MVTTRFIATQSESGNETIALIREQAGGLFRRASSETVPVSEWPRVAPEGGQAALALARALDEHGQIDEEAEGIVLPPEIVAQLDEADAFALGLPPATPLTLQLNSGGSLANGTIRVDTKWVRRGGLPVRADIEGARVREGGRVGRIPEPIYSVFRTALAVNAADDPDERRAEHLERRAQARERLRARDVLGEERTDGKAAAHAEAAQDLRQHQGAHHPVLHSGRVRDAARLGLAGRHR